jgi:hypothetical protein
MRKSASVAARATNWTILHTLIANSTAIVGTPTYTPAQIVVDANGNYFAQKLDGSNSKPIG